MSFGSNLQFLRKMHHAMTQEELADQMGVSRQTVSKWEMDGAFPEMEKAIALSTYFNCSLDELLREDMNPENHSYQHIRVEEVPSFKYYKYAVISENPEDDAKKHVMEYIKEHALPAYIIGWDFPYVSQEQINVFHMHGYQAACVVEDETTIHSKDFITQATAKYVALTIVEPFNNPFSIIPNAYKMLFRYMEMNGLRANQNKDLLSCFEKEYVVEKVQYMDVYIAINEVA